jgi:hypothetical protein
MIVQIPSQNVYVASKFSSFRQCARATLSRSPVRLSPA